MDTRTTGPISGQSYRSCYRAHSRSRRMQATSSATAGAVPTQQTHCHQDFHAKCHANYPALLFGLGNREITGKLYWSF